MRQGTAVAVGFPEVSDRDALTGIPRDGAGRRMTPSSVPICSHRTRSSRRGLLFAAVMLVSYEPYTYQPHGQPSSVDKLISGTAPQNAVGHQGLIFDRYCGNAPTDPCILTSQKGLYHNRNRYYHAKLGRFTTPDPIATGSTLVSNENSSFVPIDDCATLCESGCDDCGCDCASTTTGTVDPPESSEQYRDGTNKYSFVNGNPLTATDPLGLEASVAEVSVTTSLTTGLISQILLGGWGTVMLTKALNGTSGDMMMGPPITDTAAGEEGPCEFYLAWCTWANGRPPGDPGKGWGKNMPCASCYATCKSTGKWPFARCQFPPKWPRWPRPKDGWDPVWPTPGEY